MVRAGRDVATSSNQNQLDRHGHGWLSPRERTFDRPVQSVLLWRRLNEAMCEYGETAMGEAYTRVRLEDLCQDPETSIRRLYERTGLDGRADPRRVVEIEVTPPASLGRSPTLAPETRSTHERRGVRPDWIRVYARSIAVVAALDPGGRSAQL